MPKPPRFSTLTAQQMAVAVVTLLVLAVALGLAQLFTVTHQPTFGTSLSEQFVNDLRLQLPDQWERHEADAAGQGFVGQVVTLVDPAIKGRYMSVSEPIILVPSSPDEVLRETLNIVTFRNSRLFFDQDKVQRFRVGTMTGAYYNAQSQAPGKATISSDRFVVLTEDGRRHWIIAMHMPRHPSPKAEQAQDELMMQIAKSAVDTGSRDASAGQFKAAGLAALAGVELPLAARASAPSKRDDQALYFTLTGDAVPHLGLVRVRTQHSAAPESDAAISAPIGLTRLYRAVHGRSPEASQLTQEQVAGRSATRIILSDGAQRSLHREVIHLVLDDDRALLLDLLAEPAALEAIKARVAALVETMVKLPPPSPLPPSARSGLTGALERGRDLALAQREQMVSRFEPMQRAFLLRREDEVVGTQLHDQHHLPEQGLPLRSRKMRAYVRGQDSTVAWANWFGSLDGQTIESTTVNEIREGPIHRSYAYQFTLKDGKLTASMVPARAGRDPIWSQPVAPGYVPGFAEDSWDLSALAKLAADSPALIWRSRDTQPPEPHWIQYVPLASESESKTTAKPAAAFAFVRIRPMMSMDGQRLWLDRDGRVIASDWIDLAQSPTGGIRLSLTPTDFKTVSRLYASHDFLRLWQQDVDQP